MTYAPVEITAKDKEEFFQGITYSYGSSSGISTASRGAPDFVRKLTEFPKVKPPFQEFKSRSGRQHLDPAVSGRGGRQSGFDAFDPSGKFLGVVRIADGGSFPGLMVWVKDGFWTIRAGEDGEYAIVKYRIDAAK